MGLKVTNNAYGTLNASITSSATTIVLVSGQGARFPTLSAGDYFYATLIDTSNNLEIVKVTARSTDTLTVVRGQDNTTARAYATNDRFELRPTAALFNEKANDVDVIATYLPKAGGTMTGKLAIGSGVTPVTALHAQSSASEADRSLRLAYDGTYFSEIRQLGAAGMAFRNNNTDNQMLLDGAGRLSKPYQTAFFANRTSHVTSTGTIVFDSVAHNDGSAYNNSTGVFTAPVAGKYVFTFSCLLYNMGSASNASLYVNGGSYGGMSAFGTYGSNFT